MIKNADFDKYKYSGYVIGFYRHGSFLFNNRINRNIIIFRVDISSYILVDNKIKDILILLSIHELQKLSILLILQSAIKHFV